MRTRPQPCRTRSLCGQSSRLSLFPCSLVKELQLISRSEAPSLLTQLVSELHEQDSKSVLATSISSVSPVTVLESVLDQRLVSGAQEFFSEVMVGLELEPESHHHDIFFHFFPVGVAWKLLVAAQFEGLGWSGRIGHHLLFRMPLVLFTLKIVFVGRVEGLSDHKGGWVKVAHPAVSTLGSIELDLSLALYQGQFLGRGFFGLRTFGPLGQPCLLL